MQHVVLVPNLNAHAKIADTEDYISVTARNDAETSGFEPEWLAFDPVLCVGGSWVSPKGAPDQSKVEALAREAAALGR